MHSPSQPPFPSIHARTHTHKNLFSGVYHLSFSFTLSFWKRNPGQFHCTINTALKQLIDLSFTHTLELHPCVASDEYETFTEKPYESQIFPCTFHPTRDMNEFVLCQGKMQYYYCSKPSDLQQKSHFHQQRKNVVHYFTCSNINPQMPFWCDHMRLNKNTWI